MRFPNLMRLILLAGLLIQPLPHALATAMAQADLGAQDRGLTLVGQYGGELGAIAVREPYAYLRVGPRLVVVDISNPRDMVVVGQTPPTSALAVDIVVRGDYAYVAQSGGLGIVDISDPTHPVEVGSVAIAVPLPAPLPASIVGTPRRVALDGSYAFVAAMAAGVWIIDVSDPRRPIEVGAWLPVQGETEEVVDVATAPGAIGYVYVGTQRAGGAFTAENGLHILDVSRPADPREVSFCLHYQSSARHCGVRPSRLPGRAPAARPRYLRPELADSCPGGIRPFSRTARDDRRGLPLCGRPDLRHFQPRPAAPHRRASES